MKYIETELAPTPNGHYSQGIAWKDLIFTSAQLPINPTVKKNESLNVHQQTEILLNNILNIIVTAGGNKQTIIKVTFFISDMDHWSAINEVYTAFMGESRPARSVLAVQSIHQGFDVSCEAIAFKSE